MLRIAVAVLRKQCRLSQELDDKCHEGRVGRGKPQISLLRYAPVEMTILFEDGIQRFHEGSAVSLQVYSHPLLRASRAASIRFAAPNLLIASDK
jgi:hypothetical protein